MAVPCSPDMHSPLSQCLSQHEDDDEFTFAKSQCCMLSNLISFSFTGTLRCKYDLAQLKKRNYKTFLVQGHTCPRSYPQEVAEKGLGAHLPASETSASFHLSGGVDVASLDACL